MSNEIEFILYSLPEEEGRVQVVIKEETLWCTQKAMAQLFGKGFVMDDVRLKQGTSVFGKDYFREFRQLKPNRKLKRNMIFSTKLNA